LLAHWLVSFGFLGAVLLRRKAHPSGLRFPKQDNRAMYAICLVIESPRLDVTLTVNVWVFGFIGCCGFDMGIGDSFNVFLSFGEGGVSELGVEAPASCRRRCRSFASSLKRNVFAGPAEVYIHG